MQPSIPGLRLFHLLTRIPDVLKDDFHNLRDSHLIFFGDFRKHPVLPEVK